MFFNVVEVWNNLKESIKLKKREKEDRERGERALWNLVMKELGLYFECGMDLLLKKKLVHWRELFVLASVSERTPGATMPSSTSDHVAVSWYRDRLTCTLTLTVDVSRTWVSITLFISIPECGWRRDNYGRLARTVYKL